MTLPSQLTSLPLSQRLQKLGVPQTAYFMHRADGLGIVRYEEVRDTAEFRDGCFVSAYTVSELGMLLPQGSASFLRDNLKEWRCLPGRTLHNIVPDIDAENEAEARGLMLAYLLESGLITSSLLVV